MEVYEELGLKKSEYEKIVEELGRDPNYLELAIYSLMWSEHCGYKHSKEILRLLPSKAPHVLQGPGENAGIIDIGDGLAIAFKMESHNHPSAIEPFQGAATGVGGIVRDILAMGARPIACLDSLRFGPLKKPRQKYLFEGVVGGIASYGNCIGVPTVGGDVYFEDAYEGNCLVNVMCVGLMEHTRLIKGVAVGHGNLLLLIGSKTGRDGIGGASILASQEFDEGSEAKRPSVQVGDPFTEKLLIEACLELLDKDLLVALQDLGAAGLTSSSSEMAAKGKVGVDIDVSKAPLREKGMEPFEIMISESQERMLAIIEPSKLAQAEAVCQKWGLLSTVIGQVTDTGLVRIYQGEELVGEMPAKSLGEEAPVYSPVARKPAYLDEKHRSDLSGLSPPTDFNSALKDLLASSNLASRQSVFSQYDHMIQLNTAVLPGSADAAVLRIKGTNKAIAVSSDCNGRYCYLHPRRGAQIAVAEAARNVVCTGARPLAVTDCLNFGSPEDPEIFWQFKEAVEGLAEACRSLDVPVVSGNVSFYNESFGQAIYPTPMVGLIGLVEDIDHICTTGFKEEGSVIILLGETLPELGGSEFIKVIHGLVEGEPPALDLELEKRIQTCALEAIKEGFVLSAHDCAEGGLAVALAECCLSGDFGARVDLEESSRPEEVLFSESQSRIILSLRGEDLPRLRMLAQKHEVPLDVLGHVSGMRLVISDKIDLEITELESIWGNALENSLNS